MLEARACKDASVLALTLLPAPLPLQVAHDDEDTVLADAEKVAEAFAATLAVALVAAELFAEKFAAT
jgi:hypothetical protein